MKLDAKKIVLEGKLRMIREQNIPLISGGVTIEDVTLDECGTVDVDIFWYEEAINQAYDKAQELMYRKSNS
jgi:hypothetical protein